MQKMVAQPHQYLDLIVFTFRRETAFSAFACIATATTFKKPARLWERRTSLPMGTVVALSCEKGLFLPQKHASPGSRRTTEALHLRA